VAVRQVRLLDPRLAEALARDELLARQVDRRSGHEEPELELVPAPLPR